MGAPRQRSLKARALQWLAQREHSRVELERKLMRAARADQRARELERTPEGEQGGEPPARSEAFDADAARREVEVLLDWLQEHRFLAIDRFVESRVHARASRFGNLRIRQELAQHALELGDDARRALDESEPARARAVRDRRFEQAPDTPRERARQARFLAARGFSADVIQRVLREAARGESTDR